MSSPEPSRDPNRTVTQEHKPLPETIDVSRPEESTGQTGPSVAPALADAPSIPGYRVTAEIARGGMGRVCAGYDLTLDREVAIKTLLPGANAERFITEAKITARLPHPGIPPVHALGTLDDGTPWLAMKLIRGRTLAELLKKGSSPSEELPRFIQIFEQIAQAVGFAHSRGIIHRDLKPLNVMVGEFGEVQVMDWGLAKDTTSRGRQSAGDAGDDSEPDDSRRRREDDNVHHTTAGTIMGTPAYMAPEQARGEVVDARADVFSLGSILAAILTGKPAFVGTSTYETISKAASADLADVLARLETCGADAELVAIARRCLAAQRDDRFADGREVASAVAAYRATVEARLRQAETAAAEALVREAEQRKRRRLAVGLGGSIAAVLLIGLAVSLWLMNRAIDAERQAVADRDAKDIALMAESAAREAEQKARERSMAALRMMTDQTVEDQLARAENLTEQNKQFLGKVIEHYEALAAITPNHAESRAIRAEGHFGVARIRGHLGDDKAAEAAYREAMALYTQLAADYPTHPDYRHDLAVTQQNIGLLLSNAGRLPEAEAAYREAFALLTQLAADFPTRAEYRQELAASHDFLGVLLHETDRQREAEANHRQALTILEQLVEEHPANFDYSRDLAKSHHNMGLLWSDMGRLQDAERAYRKALNIYTQLAIDYPRRTEIRQDLARSHMMIGILFKEMGRLKDAEEAYREAVKIRKQLAADFPTRHQFRFELTNIQNNLGNFFSHCGRLQEAEAAYRESLAIGQQLAADFPDYPEYRRRVGTSNLNLGVLLRDTGRHKEAEVAYREAHSHYKRLAADFPTSSEYRDALAKCLNNLANLLRDTGRPKEAETAHREALDLRKELCSEFPDRPDFRMALARSLNNLGNLLRATGQLEEAEVVHREALALRKQLAADYPNRPEYRQELATSHHNLGILLRDIGRLNDAEAAYGEALLLKKQLATDYPEVPEYRDDVAGTLLGLAIICKQQTKYAAAKAYLEEARPFHLAALKANPKHPTYRQSYRNNLANLTQAHAGLLDQVPAIKTAEQIRDLGSDAAGNVYDAACALALCIPIVEKHEKLDAKERQAAVQFYGDEAMKLLRDAVAKGFQDAAHMKKDSDLDPLRGRDDFQKLLADLEAKPELRAGKEAKPK